MARNPDPQVAAWFGETSMARAQGHLSRLGEALRNKGGFTTSAVTGEDPTSGHAVASYGHEAASKASATGSTVGQRIQSYAQKNEAALRQPGRVIGGWRTKEQGRKRDYFDVSTVYPENNAGRKQAALGSMVNNQRAFYSIGSGQETSNPSFEEGKGAQARRISRMKGENVTDRPPKLPHLD